MFLLLVFWLESTESTVLTRGWEALFHDPNFHHLQEQKRLSVKEKTQDEFLNSKNKEKNFLPQ